MQGVLFRYGSAAPQVAFRSGAASRHLVLVSGLTEGLLFAPYVTQLATAAEQAGYSLVQAQMSSSYQGWGAGSLDADADELLLLSRHLRSNLNSQGMVLMGHSTGCQDAVRFCQRHGQAEGVAALQGVILQAPASDREWLSHFYPDVVKLLPEAQRMLDSGRGDDIICRAPEDLGSAPLSARRLVALTARLGDDDMWSWDLTPEELHQLLAPLQPWPLLLLQSGADECIVDASTIPTMGQRIMQAAAAHATSEQLHPVGAAPQQHQCGGAAAGGVASERVVEGARADMEGCNAAALRRHVVIQGASHNAAGHEEELAEHVGVFLGELCMAARA